MTPAKRRVAAEVQRRSKGWPVGIPVNPHMARTLVNNGYAEWAVPLFNYRTTVHAIRLTLKGEVELGLPKSKNGAI